MFGPVRGEKMDRPAARSFEDLIVWRKAHELVIETYNAPRDFPRDEVFGLRAQLRRAIVSVPANIAEGFIKRTRPDKLRFFNIAQGSLEESRYYFLLAHDLKFMDSSQLKERAMEVSRLLNSYMKTIEDRD